MIEMTFKKAWQLRAFLKTGKMLTFDECEYVYSDKQGALVIRGTNHGEVFLEKQLLGDVYEAETRSSELRLLAP